ncbi:hypothetical protein [Faecalimicrobium dakarense]|uniref:hypothetical protein n=1 Tax=Faecalimicrobium dakarense TaxID=1301100 RepID=UPI0004B229A3|nr:hypothetical protein [[Clostridium] dakarense]
MISARVSEGEKIVYVDVSGYITSRDASDFMQNYRQMTKGVKTSQYRLVVTPSIFECENNEDIRTVCMSFLKGGYKKMYLVDPRNYIMGSLSLGTIEKKLFTKSVKIIGSVNDIK